MVHKISIFFKTKFPKLIWKYVPFIWRGNTDTSIKGVERLFLQSEDSMMQMLNSTIHDLLLCNNMHEDAKICELGSGSGGRLYQLSKEFPKFSYLGLDINKRFVNSGNEYFRRISQKKKNINVNLRYCDLEHISLNERYDIIFTSMVLMYVSPKKIYDCIDHIQKSSNIGFILQEFVGVDDKDNPIAGYLHDYVEIFKDLHLHDNFEVEIEVIKGMQYYDGNTFARHQITAIRKC